MNATSPERLQCVSALRAVILLAGRIGRDPFADGVGRSALDLPVDDVRTVSDVWAEQFGDVARLFGPDGLRVLVSVDCGGPRPHVRPGRGPSRVEWSVVRDRAEYRGTAGVVRDLTTGFDDDDRVLVVTAGLVQRESLADVVGRLTRAEEGVCVVPHDGGDHATAFLLRCGRLRGVPDVGFVDLKEQAIPAGRGYGPLSVVRRPAGSALPIRTLAEYVHALRAVRGECAETWAEDPFAETWSPRFALVEPGAHVAPGAVLLDSVVLAGGRVEDGAVVARSVVCAGGVVRRGSHLVESVAAE